MKFLLGKKVLFPILLVAFTNVQTSGQFIDTSRDRVKTPLQVDLKYAGTLAPRSTKEIVSSRITVGCETLDRDYAVWDNYKAYLPPLGVKKIRLQAGWAKCEKVKGVYDWEWLDKIIDYAVQNNIEPWLQTSYGNSLYEGGGETGLGARLMSPEGMEGWDNWVKALVSRYKGRVKEWEIWNEPDLAQIKAEAAAELNARTATIIKSIQPEAKIAGLAFASNSNAVYLDRFLKVIADQNKLDLFTWISYHSYNSCPEQSFAESRVPGLQKVIRKYSDKILLRQGETGAPSTYIPGFALSKYYWTEYTQAKYDMRRLLSDLGHDIETQVFTMIDIYYDYKNPTKPSVLNTKGLIQSDTTMAAIRPKVAYYAVQNIASVFDNQLVLNPAFSYESSASASASVHAYQNSVTKKDLVTFWFDGQIPSNSFKTKPVNFTFKNVTFKKPVWVDLLTGAIYKIPSSQWKQSGSSCTFTDIPMYDAPVMIAEADMLKH